MAWAVSSDVRDAWIGDDLTASDSAIEKQIGRAERMILRRVPGVTASIAASRISVEDVRDVVVEMVTRVLLNPKRVRQRSTTTGPASASETTSGDTPGEMYISETELSDLLAAGGSRGRAFSINTAPGYP